MAMRHANAAIPALLEIVTNYVDMFHLNDQF